MKGPGIITAYLTYAVVLLIFIKQDQVECATATLSSNVPPSELFALEDLYNATRGQEWNWMNDSSYGVKWQFNADSNPCNQSWQGVICSMLNTTENSPYRYVTGIELPVYNLNGSLPNSIGSFSKLQTLTLNNNSITGSLPDTLGNLTFLASMKLDVNRLNSTIPETMTNLSYLSYLSMGYNDIVGPLPMSIGNLSSLETLNLEFDNITSTIPETLGQLANLRYLILRANSIYGTLPASLGNATSLVVLNVYLNSLTGSIPESYYHMSDIVDFDMSDNQLTGSMPDFLCDFSHVRSIYLAYNKFSGKIPTDLGSLSNLEYLYMNDNQLTGIIPPSVANMSKLVGLLLYNNQLHGNLDYVFNATIQTKLSNVLLGYNQFSGSIPAELFRLPSLQNLELVSNCFHGDLMADGICNATGLLILAMDGLRAATSCRNELFPGLDTSYILTQPLTGGIPPCVFSLPRLTTLHVSGNGLTGSLPGDIELSKSLNDVSLSHNLLTGDIPDVIQQRTWTNLDLSYNRIGGSLIGGFAAQYLNTSLSLQENRLSGAIPRSLWHAFNISVLNGNIFHCNIVNRNNLPHHDAAAKNYQCGSALFDVAYYAWADTIALLVLLVLGIVIYFRRDVDSACRAMLNAFNQCRSYLQIKDLLDESGLVGGVSLKRYIRICNATRLITRFAVGCMVYIIVILLPAYTLLSYYYSTHAFQYAYTTSVIFLSGAVPFAIIFTLMICFWVFALWMYHYILQHMEHKRYRARTTALSAGSSMDHSTTSSTSGYSSSTTSLPRANADAPAMMLESSRDSMLNASEQPWWEKFLIYMLFGLLNLVVVVSANYAFVYVYVTGSNLQLTVAQVVLSLFKIGWNHLCSRVSYYLSITGSSSRISPKKGILTVLIILTLFNIIAVPCLVIGSVSGQCLYNVVVPAPSVTSSITYGQCFAYNETSCVQTSDVTRETTYAPPFQYSYQCSNKIVTAYAPSFVYLGIVISFISPALKCFGWWLLRQATPGTFLYWILFQLLPWILKPQVDATNNQPVALEGTWWHAVVRMCCASWLIVPTGRYSVKTSIEVPRPRFSPYFDARRLLVINLNFLGILMTFGAIFPPLAAVMALAIASSVAFSRWETKNFIKDAVENNRSAYIRAIDDDCRGVGTASMMLRSVWILIIVSCWFYTLFFFDILGDEVGYFDSFWVLIVGPTLPFCLLVMLRMYRNRRQIYSGLFFAAKDDTTSAASSGKRNTENISSIGIEDDDSDGDDSRSSNNNNVGCVNSISGHHDNNNYNSYSSSSSSSSIVKSESALELVANPSFSATTTAAPTQWVADDDNAGGVPVVDDGAYSTGETRNPMMKETGPVCEV